MTWPARFAAMSCFLRWSGRLARTSLVAPPSFSQRWMERWLGLCVRFGRLSAMSPTYRCSASPLGEVLSDAAEKVLPLVTKPIGQARVENHVRNLVEFGSGAVNVLLRYSNGNAPETVYTWFHRRAEVVHPTDLCVHGSRLRSLPYSRDVSRTGHLFATMSRSSGSIASTVSKVSICPRSISSCSSESFSPRKVACLSAVCVIATRPSLPSPPAGPRLWRAERRHTRIER